MCGRCGRSGAVVSLCVSGSRESVLAHAEALALC